EDLRSDSVLFAAEWRCETLRARKDRVHRQALTGDRTHPHCSWVENADDLQRPIAHLFDSLPAAFAHIAVSGASEPARPRRNSRTGTACYPRIERSVPSALESDRHRPFPENSGHRLLSFAFHRSILVRQ